MLVALLVSLVTLVAVRGQITDEEEGVQWLKFHDVEFSQYLYNSVSAAWKYNTNITDHNLALQIEADAALAEFQKDAYEGAMAFAWQDFSAPVRRHFSKVVDIGPAVLPEDEFNQMNELNAQMVSMYSTAKVCDKPGDNSGKCYPLDPDLDTIMANSRDWDELVWAWQGWRNSSAREMRPLFSQFVDFQNQAAVMNKFADHGEYWRSWYEVEDLEAITAKLWAEVKPFYEQLHAYVRKILKQVYSGRPFPETGHIPAHLLGNMWAQQWNNIEKLLLPFPEKPSVDVTDELISQGYDTIRLFELAEDFFTSLGLIPMPDSFWKDSMLEKPEERDVVCHASAWDFYNQKDFRIKQCTEINTGWLFTTHHEMGHVEYFLQYKDQPTVYRDGGNPGFHEAIGDVMELSVSTPEHLHKVGLMPDFEPDEELDLNFLMNMALRKIAFLPFGYLIDQWRWNVFRGESTPDTYNDDWWALRCDIQGLSPAVDRNGKIDFDPGAKFHVPNNTPYIRYFLSHILQFQFHEALCKAAGHNGPLFKCDIYNSVEAGNLLANLMEVGSSVHWNETLELVTGSPDMSAQPLVDYFQPLMDWLQEQNQGEDIGWEQECPKTTQ